MVNKLSRRSQPLQSLTRLMSVAVLVISAFAVCAAVAQAETGYKGWLQYAPIHDAAVLRRYGSLPAVVVTLHDSPIMQSAQWEMIRGVRGMLGRTLRAESRIPDESAIVMGTLPDLHRALPGLALDAKLKPDGYWLRSVSVGRRPCLLIAAINDRGVLYGAFAVLRKLALREPLSSLNEVSNPSAPVRWVNQWDNLNGRIERGYGGHSIFFADGHVAPDLGRVRDFARLLASLGINGCTVNNVNADPRLLTAPYLAGLARIAEVFEPWGVRVSIAVDLSSPEKVGGLNTFDPLDPRVADWWRQKADEVYQAIPGLAGFLMKADSEGRPGPSTYGRTQADAANVVARALAPHGGILLYRAFVYNNHLDWRNPKNDRARAAYDVFHPLDGKFDANVVVQIKNGPIDFQVREPASPLFSGLKKTNEAIELQITQEYTGQQRQLCFLPPMWKATLDFDTHARPSHSRVMDLVTGRTFHRPLGGFVGVSNVGQDPTWMGSHLAMANLYGFGRLAWNPEISAQQIASEWTRQTFGSNPTALATISDMLLRSWRIYENYTGPLGLGTLTNILGSHYGPDPQSAERNGWGQWIRADSKGIGMDRTVATGTGYIGQYPPEAAKVYESLPTCPDDLLLFMHHVPYTYKLRSGKTVIQYVYDSHYEGAKEAAGLVAEWETLRSQVDEQRYQEVLARLQYQAGAAIVWRDAICNWFFRESGIPDGSGRVGHYPGRMEAESMELEGYKPVDVTPWEDASGGKAIVCSSLARQCSASFQFNGRAGWYDMSIEYFDQLNGVSHYKIYVGAQLVDEWAADDHLPSWKPDGSSSTRRVIRGLALRPGDKIRIEGQPDGQEYAPLDYVELRRDEHD